MAKQNVEIEVVGDIKQIVSSLNQLDQRFNMFANSVGASTEKANKRLGGLATGIIKAGATIKSGVYIVKSFTTALTKLTAASDAQEKAEAALEQAMINTGRYTKDAFENLKIFASERQKMTIYGDEATLQATAILQAMTGLNEKGLKPLIEATQDFASAQRMDLVSAAELVAKTIGSETNALARYGIKLSDTNDKNQRAAELVTNVKSKFGGLSEQLARTDFGKLAIMTNALSDSTEAASLLLKKGISPLAERVTVIANKWTEFIVQLSESKLETAVRQLREMGIEAERLAGLEYMINMEKATDALMNNNKKIRKILEDTNKGLTESTAKALGIVVKSWTETKNIGHGEYVDITKRMYNIRDISAITAEKITEQIEKERQEVANLISGKENLSEIERGRVAMYSREIEILSNVLKLILERDKAQEIINKGIKTNFEDINKIAQDTKIISEEDQKLKDQIYQIELKRLPISEQIIALSTQANDIDQGTLAGRLKYLQIQQEILTLSEQLKDIEKAEREATERLARAWSKEYIEREDQKLGAIIDRIQAEYDAEKEETNKKKQLWIDLQNAKAEYLEWEKAQTRKTQEEITAIITGSGFSNAYDSIIERVRQRLIAAAIEETKLALWVEKTKFAIKEAWAGRTLAMEQLFSGKEIALNLKTTLSNFIAGLANLFKSVMKIPFPGNIIAFGIGGATVISLLQSFKTKGEGIIKAAEGALINRPTLALVGEAITHSGPELITPMKTFRQVINEQILPELRAKIDNNIALDTKGIESRLERVESAIYATRNNLTERGIAKAVVRTSRRKLS